MTQKTQNQKGELKAIGYEQFMRQRAENALLTVVFLVLCVLQFGALAVLRAERGSPDASITRASDALWWVFVTVTTVGLATAIRSPMPVAQLRFWS